MGRKRDRFWDYAEDLKGHFKCNYCKHKFSGGASRIKSHLAGVKGHDILICDFVLEDVQKEAYEATQGTTKNLKMLQSQVVIRRVQSPQLQFQQFKRKKLSHRSLTSPNSTHSCLFVTIPHF